jgi:aryl-alcohol dehydrogenase-like predicted oxidoreductase
MKLSRREMVKLGVVAGASTLFPDIPLFAQGGDIVERPIPSSGELLPVVGIGTARRYDVGETAAERAPLKDTLARFAELGGKVIDTAPSYGTAEPVLGDLISQLGIRDKLFLATKVGARGKDEGLAELNASFQRLRTDKIDLIAVHNLIDTDTQIGNLRDLKAAGRIRYIGMTTSSDRQHEPFAAKMAEVKPDVVQVDYSLDDRSVEERILPQAIDQGAAVWTNLPFGRGRLFETVGDRPLPEWAAEFDCKSWAQFFLKFLLGHPAVTCVIPGTSKVSYADDNFAAARGRMPTEAERQQMVQFIESL